MTFAVPGEKKLEREKERASSTAYIHIIYTVIYLHVRLQEGIVEGEESEAGGGQGRP